MGWYRTRAGRLLYGKGGLAKVYEDRGYTPVDDEVAEAEVASGEAQVRADVEGELAAEVDARVDAGSQEPGREPVVVASTAHTVPTADGTALLTTDHETRHELTPEEQAAVDAAIEQESPGGFLRR